MDDADDISVTPPQLSISERIILAQQAYQEFRFQEIVDLLENDLLDPSLFKNPAQLTEARALTGSALFHLAQSSRQPAEKQTLLSKSESHLLNLLRKEPDYNLDPYLFSRSATEHLEAIRNKHIEELNAIRAEQSTTPNDSGNPVIYIERATRKQKRILNFAPFALGQFQNNQEVKGTILAMGQSIGLAVNITGYIRNQLVVSSLPGGRFPRQDDNNPGPEISTAQTFRIIQYAGLAMFALFYSYSVVDGLYYYQPEQLLEIKTLDGPPPELQPQSQLPPLNTQIQWTLAF